MISTGYSLVPKRDLTTAISSLVGSREEAARFAHVEEMLAGRVAGVDVPRTGSGFSVRIRGMRSLHADSEPLYIVDGVALRSGSGRMFGINPHDVERIDVLKDAGSAAIHGVRGANGVIVITPRRGR